MIKNYSALGLAIQCFAKKRNLSKGKQVHCHLVRLYNEPCTFITNHLINMYMKCGRIDCALNLFDKMPERNLVSWTAMVSGFSQNGYFVEAAEIFCSMRRAGEKPTQFAFSSVVQSISSLRSLEYGKQIHCLSIKMGFDAELFVGSNLADMYSKCNELGDACLLFDQMPEKDVVSWTALIDGYTKNECFEDALVTFGKMYREDIRVDPHVLTGTLTSCGGLKNSKIGKILHSFIVKKGFESDVIVKNALIDMYSKSGDLESAAFVLGKEPQYRNVVSYSSLIDGFVEGDQFDKALSIFVESQRLGIVPNEFTFSSLVKACASQAAIEQGTQLHAQLIKTSFDEDPFVSSVLVDMYGKCGLLDSSIRIFDAITNPTEIAWNSLVNVFAQHGNGYEAIRIFEQMISRGMNPNRITFISLLTACSHAGLVKEGLKYFDSMSKVYSIEPQPEHYTCVIDLLSRSGKLKEAEEFINQMPFEPNAFGWCSLLGGCRTHGDTIRGEFAAKKLLELEPENGGTQILLSNIYAGSGQWENVKNVRKTMRGSKIKKLPGYSWVDLGNMSHIFGADDWSHPQKKQIYEKLEKISIEIKQAGYVPDTDSVPCNVEESLKEKLLEHHSERIAIAFALISFPTGKPIIVKKNIRVCVDCHSAIKFISKVVERKIIVRDNSRFHHFSDGLCSCGDYW